MKSIYIGFSSGLSFDSKLIRYFQNGYKYTHMFYSLSNKFDGVDLNDLEKIEAWASPILKGGGVYYNKKIHTENTPYKILRFSVSYEKQQKLESYLYFKLGNKYDYLGILGIILQQNIDSKNRWFCTELILNALEFAEIIDDVDSIKKLDLKYSYEKVIKSKYYREKIIPDSSSV